VEGRNKHGESVLRGAAATENSALVERILSSTIGDKMPELATAPVAKLTVLSISSSDGEASLKGVAKHRARSAYVDFPRAATGQTASTRSFRTAYI